MTPSQWNYDFPIEQFVVIVFGFEVIGFTLFLKYIPIYPVDAYSEYSLLKFS